jgi:hypothetical protein
MDPGGEGGTERGDSEQWSVVSNGPRLGSIVHIPIVRLRRVIKCKTRG